ncbi:MAG: DHH family phosphoesterase [Clostridiales Family XIII bacterium]|jgi:c-di-AMP phosphodiesterase-like protein|nr:DHH family phosphoesterase [Clostridiales Family XIII bacterium]
MGNKILKTITGPYLKGSAAALVLLVAALFYYGRIAGHGWITGLCALAVALVFGAFCLILRARQRVWVNTYLENIVDEIDATMRYATRNHPLPLCILDEEGVVLLANLKFKELYPDTVIMKSNIFQLTGKKQGDFLPEEPDIPALLQTHERIYRVIPAYMNAELHKTAMLYWIDVTNYEKLKKIYNSERKCVAHIQVDNYDDLLSSSPDDKKSLIAASIEKVIRQWAAKMDASVIRYYTSKYFVVFEHKDYEKLVAEKFNVLGETRAIETDADFPVSLSIGVGVGGKTPQQTDEYAVFALDLALGRGGDQAVVKRGSKVDYYGGTLQVVERRNKGKSRVMAHALRQLIDQSSKVIIMGHKNPDIDSFGAAVGVARLAMNQQRDAFIVVNEYNHSLDDFFQAAERSGEYRFISGEAAAEMLDRDSLLVVVDTNKPSLAESPGLLGKTEKTVVIDHHRKSEEFIENATLSYVEPAASSTSELITEILQYLADKKSILRLEAEMLLGGIIVDTNSFSVKTGVRTFDAASWLRRSGADTALVRQYLQNDMEDFRQRASIISNAEFLDNGIAISKNEGAHANAQIINAQAADELLDIKGIRASFVVGETASEVVVSARSLGDVNVQTLMEKLGGGGHLTMAAAQIRGMTANAVIARLKKLLLEIAGSGGGPFDARR